MKTLGIDEAGRGPVIGPMVMAGVVTDEQQEEQLRNINVRDSKMIAPAVREELFEQIKSIVSDYEIVVVDPSEIDAAVESEEMNLNRLEALKSAMIMGKLYGRIKADRMILDCPSTNTADYVKTIKLFLKEGVDAKIIAEHKADVNYVSVSAASILAKVTRDRIIEELKREYHVDFGSGYPSDPKTIAFVKENFGKYPFFRKSWMTYRHAAGLVKEKKKSMQKGLSDF